MEIIKIKKTIEYFKIRCSKCEAVLEAPTEKLLRHNYNQHLNKHKKGNKK